MIQTLIKSWWLLAVCGVFEAIYAVLNLFIRDPDGSLTLRKFAISNTVVFQGRFILAAGVCILAAGLWNYKLVKSWLLVLNGLALSTFGLICIFWSRGKLSFLPVAMLLVVTALSIGIFALATALTPQQHISDKLFLGVASAASVGFAVLFFAMGFRWIHLDQPGAYFLWMSAYFGFSAICMIGLALRKNNLLTHAIA